MAIRHPEAVSIAGKMRAGSFGRHIERPPMYLHFAYLGVGHPGRNFTALLWLYLLFFPDHPFLRRPLVLISLPGGPEARPPSLPPRQFGPSPSVSAFCLYGGRAPWPKFYSFTLALLAVLS